MIRCNCAPLVLISLLVVCCLTISLVVLFFDTPDRKITRVKPLIAVLGFPCISWKVSFFVFRGVSRSVDELASHVQKRTTLYFLQQLFATCNSVICIKAGLIRGYKTRNIAI